ncbi:uncharacterized protein RHOBADRAFT_38580 [Rhodotorula graminis WP1]|uniref:Phosphoglycerate mutase-like protein n=1 Tax=Rhodotorula graminis (strain WP1) TaxID=578459 RepID=A0A0P9GJX2_RHOGW|nr:uncharacterized protein RHOBADRAFT_38580 [Rhodotorula graminis WP1]KPV73412.1 hypothetical protein RHOBADRAFT_38580 [Rhodotorula graminis WP1]
MAPVIITMVRHGESKDNLTALWAGHRDASLSNHGFTQAQRLGQAFADVPITAIYASDLKRAYTTARCIHDANRSTPKPPFTLSPLLREQFFGEAEGAPVLSRTVGTGADSLRVFAVAHSIAPNAESLNDVARRADLVLRHFVLPHVLATAQVPPDASFPDQHHIVLVAHGIWLSEMLFALKRAGDPHIRFVKSSGYTNTGWCRIELELDDPDAAHALPSESTSPKDEAAPSAPPAAPASSIPEPADARPATDPERIGVLAFNQVAHLEGLKRTGGGVGSAEHDDKQRGLKEFFGGQAAGK